jgi:HAD superfamily hydrolase (TIGR01549 family)
LIKAVFFDLGGTLLVMRRDRILQKVLKDERHEAGLKAIRTSYGEMEPIWLDYYSKHSATGKDATEAYRRLDVMVLERLKISGSVEEAERLSWLVRERWEKIGKSIPPKLYPDAKPVLSKLSRLGIKLALVSNAPPDTSKTVDELGLPQYIKNVVISGIVGYSKPNPEIFRIALSQASVKPGETIHVGDVYASDVVGARNAGIKGVLLDRDKVSTEKDCPTIYSLPEILPMLDGPTR